MKLGSVKANQYNKDEVPDYLEKKDEIQKYVDSLTNMKAKLDEIDEEFPVREEAVDTLINKSRQVDDNKSL